MTANRSILQGIGAGALLLAAGAAPLVAQGPINTDRPDFTESTVSVDPGVFQLEAGYTFSSIGRTDRHQIGEALLRAGMIPGLEARIGLPSFFSSKTELPLGTESEASGIGDGSLGIKLGLYESAVSEGLPSVALLLGTSVPIGDDDFGADGWEPEAKLALGWLLTQRLNLGANINYAQRDPGAGDRFDEFGASVSLGFPLTERLSGFGEYFAIRPDFGGDSDYIDAGVTFLLSNDFQLDARIGTGVGDTDDAIFFGAGFGKRF